MAQITYFGRALTDLELLDEFLMLEDPVAEIDTFRLMAEAVSLLQRHFLIGGPVDELRELAISRGRSGYLAPYSFEPAYNAILILAIRHQREEDSLSRNHGVGRGVRRYSIKLNRWCPRPESNRHASRRGIFLPLRLSPPLAGSWSGARLHHGLATVGARRLLSTPSLYQGLARH